MPRWYSINYRSCDWHAWHPQERHMHPTKKNIRYTINHWMRFRASLCLTFWHETFKGGFKIILLHDTFQTDIIHIWRSTYIHPIPVSPGPSIPAKLRNITWQMALWSVLHASRSSHWDQHLPTNRRPYATYDCDAIRNLCFNQWRCSATPAGDDESGSLQTFSHGKE